jgi:hypothetical protein
MNLLIYFIEGQLIVINFLVAGALIKYIGK